MQKLSNACPCGSGHDYKECCGSFIDGPGTPRTAEQLMRSRYSAYVSCNEKYLLDTWHRSTRPEGLSLNESRPDKWLGLKIKHTQQGGESDQKGIVEFIARYKVGGRAGRIHEVSEFVREAGSWFYVKGKMLE